MQLLTIWILFTQVILYVQCKDMRMPPSIVEQPTMKIVIFKSGEELTLPCKAAGIPAPSYEWYVGDAPFDPNTYKRMSSEDGTLIFDELNRLDEGIYQCRANNKYGMAVSNTILLIKAELRSSPIVDIQEYTVNEGDPLTVFCQPYKSYPPATYTWNIAESEIDMFPTPLQRNQRISIDPEGNLYFSHVKKADERNGYIYICNAYNVFVSQTHGSSFSHIIVNEVPEAEKVAETAPELLYHTESPKIALVGDDNVKLHCLFSGRPTPSVSWSRVGDSLPSQRTDFHFSKTELEITKVKLDDEGTYKCTGRNNKDSKVTEIKLKVEKKPVILDLHTPRNMNVTVGDMVEISCEADAIPAADIKWLRDGVEIDPDNSGSKYSISHNGKKLTMRDVCKSCGNKGMGDLAVIQCNASNIHGYDFKAGYVNVLLPTKITAFSPESVSIEHDIPVANFTIEATTDDLTPVTFVWYHEAQEEREKRDVDNYYRVYPNDEEVYSFDGKNFVINLTTIEPDFRYRYGGTYKVKATNGVSEDIKFAALEVPIPDIIEDVDTAEVVAGKDPVVNKTSSVWYITLIVAFLLLLIILILCCCICCQKNKGEYYHVDEKERANGRDPIKELNEDAFHDYHRPEDNEPVKGSRASLTSTIKLDSDDEGSLAEYGDIDTGKFNEDGSFIGQYHEDKKKKRAIDTSIA